MNARICCIDGCESRLLAKGMCIAHYNRVRKYGTPDDTPKVIRTRARMNAQREAIARMLTPEALQDGECWEWPGGRLQSGYGVFAPSLAVLSSRQAHRNAYAIAHGLTEIADDLLACHRCDNRICFRPSHIFLGSHDENMQDMVRKGRSPRVPQPKGSANMRAKFTPDDVVEILRLRSEGLLHREIAERFGVHKGTIGDLLRGHTHYIRELAS